MDALVFNLRQEHVIICDFVSTFHQVKTLFCWHCCCLSFCCAHDRHASRLVGMQQHTLPPVFYLSRMSGLHPYLKELICEVRLCWHVLSFAEFGRIGLHDILYGYADTDANPEREIHR